MRKIILASASPRRSELLKQFFTDDFEICKSDYEEVSGITDPVVLTVEFARGKAESVAAKRKGLVIAADTVVAVDGRILGKPKDKADAREMMRLLSGKPHDVITGVCIIDTQTGRELRDYRKTQVFVEPLPSEFIESYISNDEPYDKAGGYAIQGAMAKYISKIDGCYYNVVGFPVECIRELLDKMKSEE